jgi:S-adenosylmethionine synthetase
MGSSWWRCLLQKGTPTYFRFLIQDYSLVDRSGAYAARWVAKFLIAAGLAKRVLVQLSYAIGVSEPLSIYVDTYGTSRYTSTELVSVIRQNFDLRPGVIGEMRVMGELI